MFVPSIARHNRLQYNTQYWTPFTCRNRNGDLLPGWDAKSRRTPDSSTFFNNADNIERQLQADEHKIWGWVIYRTTYDNEDDWKECLSRLRRRIEESLRSCGGLDMLDSLDCTVIEDRERFDGASTSIIREDFKQ